MTKRNWPLGKIIKLFLGTDGESRQGRIKVKNGEVIRAEQNLYPLELSTAEKLPSKISGSRRCENISVEQFLFDDVPVITNRTIHTHLKSPSITKSGRAVRVPHRMDL
ncbi:integrase catalytic domain-containing protein [Nephila pilipes]|uniref:Integrase catalytic domain-containing protein n=1 Tax=Nephila pilipes TaxID=299642 RepID=A0A8X6UQ90_NEPPI|nr:integrase catalytic domain-containing protein [Nephila pilipes]